MSEEIEENLVDDICGECGSTMRVPESLVGECRRDACAEALPFLGFYDKRKIAAKDAEIARLKAESDKYRANFDAAAKVRAEQFEEIARLKAAGNVLRKALVCFNIRRHPRTSLSRDESERVVGEWDRLVGGQVEEVK